jgi:hypothetical protein
MYPDNTQPQRFFRRIRSLREVRPFPLKPVCSWVSCSVLSSHLISSFWTSAEALFASFSRYAASRHLRFRQIAPNLSSNCCWSGKPRRECRPAWRLIHKMNPRSCAIVHTGRIFCQRYCQSRQGLRTFMKRAIHVRKDVPIHHEHISATDHAPGLFHSANGS